MKLWGRKQSLQRKIIAAIVMVGLLPLTLSLVPTYLEERRVIRESIGDNFREIAVDAARRIEMQVRRGINEAQQLATTPFLRTAVIEANRGYAGKDADSIQAMIRDWQRRWRARAHHNEFPLFINSLVTNSLIQWHEIRKSDYVGILVTDSQGALVVSSIPQVEFFYGKSAWWQAVIHNRQGQVFVSDLYFDPSFGTHVQNVSVPILAEGGADSTIGAVTVLVRRDSLFHSVSEVTIGATGHAMLVSSDGTLLICPVMSPEEHAVTPALVDQIVGPRAGWAVVSDDAHGGHDSIVGFAPVRLRENLAPLSLGGKRWLTLVRQSPDETYTPLNELLARVAGYGVVVFAVLLGAGVWVAGRIVRPIETLHEGAQRIGAGNLDYQLTLKTGDELEQLADGFNRMAGNLKQSFGQLEHRMADIRGLEEKYRDLIEHSPEMIHQINKAGQFVHVNKTELEKLGYSLDEMLKMHLWDIVPKGQEKEILAYLERLVSQGRSTIETVFLTREGTPIDVEIHSTAQVDQESGGLVYSRAFVRDVTQRKLLEQKVQQYTTQLEQEVADRTHQLVVSQRRYKALFDLAADPVFMVDQDGKIFAVNQREEQALGHSEAQVVEKSFLDVVLPAYHQVTQSLITKILEGKSKVPTQEIQVWNRFGTMVDVEMDLIRIEDETTASVMVQLRDITERKRLEQRLQEYSEELELKVRERTREIEETKHYLESLLENANDVIYTLDADQNFTYVNSKVEAWGYRKEELIGRPYLSLLSKRHRGRRLKNTLDIGAKQVYEVELMSR
ncbi:MAG: PAS domain S-box protein, partial [Nitrospiraceae bacterium]